MRHSYEAEFRYSEEDGAWYAEFPGFDGSAYADGASGPLWAWLLDGSRCRAGHPRRR